MSDSKQKKVSWKKAIHTTMLIYSTISLRAELKHRETKTDRKQRTLLLQQSSKQSKMYIKSRKVLHTDQQRTINNESRYTQTVTYSISKRKIWSKRSQHVSLNPLNNKSFTNTIQFRKKGKTLFVY